ncbi:MAG: dihydrofolate reductase [Sphingobacteriales bacterium]|nr:MAG: dihydrofolate reductase [Sphingobacteriales bacterium]
MMISAIVAISENYAIGKDNQLPWHLPEDLKFFKRTTMGKPVIMGRKTYDSMGKPLKGRLNIVISRQKDVTLPEGVLLYESLDVAIQRVEEENTDEVFIIGGGQIFELSMELLDTLYLTKVNTVIEDASAYFPHVDHSHWKLTWEEAHEADEKHQFAYTFQKWERVKEI